MPDYTKNFHLKKLGANEKMSDEGYKFPGADRDLIDALLNVGLAHHHNGVAPDPQYTTGLAVPTVVLDTSIGNIPAGRRVYYKYGLVDPYGLESAASAEAYVDTPAAIGAPLAPALELVTSGGSLLPGSYYYVLTAYAPTATQETTAGTQTFIQIPSGSVNSVVLHFPIPDVAAAGFNVYRQKPGESAPHFLASVPITTPGVPPANYTDNGSVVENLDRRTPSKNSTSATNSVVVDLPGALTLPSGWTWRLYRTYLPNNYDASLLHWVVEETSEGSGIITQTYTDTGLGTFTGAPSAVSQIPAQPTKINLASEVIGVLSAANGGSGTAAALKAVKAASTANVSVSSFAGTTLDGVTLAPGDRILLKDQTTTTENGVWSYVGAAAALTRPAEFATGSDQAGALASVRAGTQAGRIFALAGTSVIVDTTAEVWTQINVESRTQMGTLLGSVPTGVALSNANDAVLVKLIPHKSLTLAVLEWFMGGAGTNNYDVGVYSDGATMNRLWSKGSTAAPAIDTARPETVSPTVPLVAGVPIWLAMAANGTTITPRGILYAFTDELLDDAGVMMVLRFATSFPLPSTLTKSSGVAGQRQYKFILRSA